MVVYEWFQDFATEYMQFVNGTVLGMVCAFGHDLSNEYGLNVHNTHYQGDELLHDGWKEEHFVLEILIISLIMCILYFCYMWL